jgi:hypothetical protein
MYFRRAGPLRTGKAKGAIMHPMFVQLYLQGEADEEREDERRRANRARRHRSRAAARVVAARDRDRQPRR